jgi:radical SAM protein with 4Fe4S-binding SPASM domain
MSGFNLHGFGNINIELTSKCNKNCWMCGRRKIDRDYPELALEYGDMDFELVKKIAAQLPPNIIVQLHNNGEALLYTRFGEAVGLFNRQITNVVTNGKLLVKKADEIIDCLDTMAISIIENDPEADEQYEIIEEFLRIKGDRKPFTILRLNGDVDQEKYKKLGLVMATRILHSPMGSFNYKMNPTIPEIGICLDFLHHLAINTKGKVSICVRFDTKGCGIIGDANTEDLGDIWNSSKRVEWLKYHMQGRRDKIPLCSYCHFWGVPTGRNTLEKTASIKEETIF